MGKTYDGGILEKTTIDQNKQQTSENNPNKQKLEYVLA